MRWLFFNQPDLDGKLPAFLRANASEIVAAVGNDGAVANLLYCIETPGGRGSYSVRDDTRAICIHAGGLGGSELLLVDLTDGLQPRGTVLELYRMLVRGLEERVQNLARFDGTLEARR